MKPRDLIYSCRQCFEHVKKCLKFIVVTESSWRKSCDVQIPQSSGCHPVSAKRRPYVRHCLLTSLTRKHFKIHQNTFKNLKFKWTYDILFDFFFNLRSISLESAPVIGPKAMAADPLSPTALHAMRRTQRTSCAAKASPTKSPS